MCYTACSKARKGGMSMQMLLLQQNRMESWTVNLLSSHTLVIVGATRERKRKEEKVEGSEGMEKKKKKRQ